MEKIVAWLKENRDIEYKAFHSKLVPTLDGECIIGVRTPILRKKAKELKGSETEEQFLTELPHRYFEENQLHGFLVSEITDFDRCIRELVKFLPYMDNWATCDQTSPKVFKKKKEKLLPYIRKWLDSDHVYTVRFGVGMLMQHFLDEDFSPEYPALVAAIRSEEYYINMEIAWYMATALAKQWDAVIPYIDEYKLPIWVHNKTIQKARESYRITLEQKKYLAEKIRK